MNKSEKIRLVDYLYHQEQRLTDAVTDCSYRFIRRELDSVDLLEEIIAKENLKLFHQITSDIVRLLALGEED